MKFKTGDHIVVKCIDDRYKIFPDCYSRYIKWIGQSGVVTQCMEDSNKSNRYLVDLIKSGTQSLYMLEHEIDFLGLVETDYEIVNSRIV